MVAAASSPWRLSESCDDLSSSLGHQLEEWSYPAWWEGTCLKGTQQAEKKVAIAWKNRGMIPRVASVIQIYYIEEDSLAGMVAFVCSQSTFSWA